MNDIEKENVDNKEANLKEKNRTIYSVIKRIFDFILSLLAIIILSPIFLIIAIIVRIDSKGPAFYVQKRIGLNGKLFKIYKFRTMVVGADKKLRKYLEENPEALEEYEKYKKLNDDPRTTKMGIFLRKTSLDELPQLINIIKGEMSIVGPRPYLLKEKKDMGKYYDSIITCKPGLTCIWQVSGRSNLSFQQRLDLDMEYLNKRSIKLDIILIFKTFYKIFKSEGAV